MPPTRCTREIRNLGKVQDEDRGVLTGVLAEELGHVKDLALHDDPRVRLLRVTFDILELKSL